MSLHLKYIVSFSLVLIATASQAQCQKRYVNDSLKIFNTLAESKSSDITFGNRINGIERHYRKIEGIWVLATITLWSDSTFVWSCKHHGFDMSNDAINLNFDKLPENTEIHIPYESGSTWLKIVVQDKVIFDITTYYRNGNVEMEYSRPKGYFKFYLQNGSLIVLKQGEFRSNGSLRNGTVKVYDMSGKLDHESEVRNLD